MTLQTEIIPQISQQRVYIEGYTGFPLPLMAEYGLKTDKTNLKIGFVLRGLEIFSHSLAT